ncbi:MAG: hypothetical protein MZV64_64055 [Ignavibacteriales bacterium]|nr:hypothetical protein [Ignavibacteriales bacterium]
MERFSRGGRSCKSQDPSDSLRPGRDPDLRPGLRRPRLRRHPEEGRLVQPALCHHAGFREEGLPQAQRGRAEGLPGALLGRPDGRRPGHLRRAAGIRQEELLEREQPAAVEHRSLPDLHPQRQPRLDRRRPERQLGHGRHALRAAPGDRPEQRGRRRQPGRDLGLSFR